MKKTLCLGVILLLGAAAMAQQPVLHTKHTSAHIRIDNGYYPDAWHIDPKLYPDQLKMNVKDQPAYFAFITRENDSISLRVEAGQNYRFCAVLNDKDTAHILVTGVAYVPPAVFSTGYIAQHRKKTFAEVPPVYELINILVAITETGKKDEWMINRRTSYYKEVLTAFEPYKHLPVVQQVDSLLKADKYYDAKMNAYSFEMDKQGQLRKSPIFDRIKWDPGNILEEMVKPLQDFVRQSGFYAFYNRHAASYKAQIKAFKDSLHVQSMQDWLNTNFPDTHYDCFKIIFSPLVYGNQSAMWFDNNGFKEAQAHVNFPYNTGTFTLSLPSAVAAVYRGNIVFTELNHAFINPESEKEKYNKPIADAFKDIFNWIEKNKPSQGYANPYTAFQEYMNWALVCVRYIDVVPAEWREKSWNDVETSMVKNRGFTHFKAFNRYFIQLYQTRKKGQVVADLYPDLIRWFSDYKPEAAD